MNQWRDSACLLVCLSVCLTAQHELKKTKNFETLRKGRRLHAYVCCCAAHINIIIIIIGLEVFSLKNFFPGVRFWWWG